jgi:CHAT domain-containing protein
LRASVRHSEQLRAREMLEQMSLGRLTAPSAGAYNLVSREQDLRRRIGELAHALDAARRSGNQRGPDVSGASATDRQALLRAQDEYTDLLLQLREREPRHARYVAPRVATWREVARRLAPDQVLVTYLVSDSGSLAFIVARDSVVAVDLPVSRRELVGLIDFARGLLMSPRAEPTSSVAWQRLNGYLITPLEETGLLAGVRRLVIVPHAELHYLPFATLMEGSGSDRVLGDRYELTVAPSASIWLELGDRAVRRAGQGTLAFAPRPEVLPASWREVASIDRVSPGPVLTRIGSMATEAYFRAEAPTRRILHLATYGLLNRHNPLFSYVELAPGGGHDGRLEVHEVMGMSLVADLVVLAACQTALGSGSQADVPPGDDWVGLTRAFLEAGATRVVAALWPVDDWATAALMDRFYGALANGVRPERALAQAQRALRAQAATSDPFYWAGFVLVGGSDRAEQGAGEARTGPVGQRASGVRVP